MIFFINKFQSYSVSVIGSNRVNVIGYLLTNNGYVELFNELDFDKNANGYTLKLYDTYEIRVDAIKNRLNDTISFLE